MIFKQPDFPPQPPQDIRNGAAAVAARIFLALQPGHGRRSHGRLHLCRAQGRLRLQPVPCRGRGGGQEDRRRHRGRGRERARDGRCVEDHGIHDQPRWRDAAVPDILRLFRPVHAGRRRKSTPTSSSGIAAGLWTDKDPPNTGSYFGYIGMGQYLNGIVAGHMTKSKKLGFVAAKPIPQVLLNINSFLLGARAVDPSITCQVIFTGEWSPAGQGGRGDQRARRPGCRRHHLPCRQPEGGHPDRGRPRRLCLRLPRQPVARWRRRNT